MGVMEHRRSWAVTIGERHHRIDIIYKALSGWMSIEVDGTRQARAWREFQTVFGGATLSCEVHGHRIEARVTQPWGRQEYSFALSIDGRVQPGSDRQPEPRALKRQTLLAIGGLALGIGLMTFLVQLLSRAG